MHYNVREFNAHSCYHTPCYNEGTCLPYLGEYTCLCAQGWSGRHCEQKGEQGLDFSKVLNKVTFMRIMGTASMM